MSRVAVVTGGTRGIGGAISCSLKGAGYTVAANYGSNDEKAKAFANKTGIPVYKCDVSDYEACRDMIAKVEKDLGAVEVLVNNAGITRDAPFHKLTPEMWQAVMRTNLDSVFNMTQAVLPFMRAQGFGRVVNISSMNGQRGQFGQVNYGAAKAGVFGFTKALAAETATKGITVNAVAPGYVDTDMFSTVSDKVKDMIIGQIPVGRLGESDEIARCVVFLASDEAGFITGSTLSVNGGQYVC